MNPIIESQLTLRKLIGTMAFILPVAVLLGGLPGFQESISAYYHTSMRDLFVGVLLGVGFFLITYKGYDGVDTKITTAAGIAGMIIAIFPCNYEPNESLIVSMFRLPSNVTGIIHLIAASAFFLLLAYMSFFQFTKSSGEMTPAKKKRNRIYRGCGIAIVAGILMTLGPSFLHIGRGFGLILISETIMLFAFGISWLVKGEAILRDSILLQ